MFLVSKRLNVLNSAACTIAITMALMGFLTTKSTAQITPKNATTGAGCLSGYPDGTFRGNRAVTRYEFAAGLNACLERIDRQIRDRNSQQATKQDFEALIQRQRELNRELDLLNERTSIPSRESSF